VTTNGPSILANFLILPETAFDPALNDRLKTAGDTLKAAIKAVRRAHKHEEKKGKLQP
jgi:hypothetical protein